MLAIDGDAVESKWVGETEHNIKAAFTLAVKLHPCIVFIDEVEALFRRRSSNDQNHTRKALTQFLSCMDGIGTGDKAPFVVVATNRPSDLDEAFLRRLPQKIFFKLPDIDSRAKILRLFLSSADDLDPSVDIDELARKTEGYSGSDLRNTCSEAHLLWLKEQTGPTGEGASEDEMTARETADDAPRKVCLRNEHFDGALRNVRPTVSIETLHDLAGFARRFNPDVLKF